MILDPQLLAKIFDCVIVELLSIVRDEDPGDFKVTNDALLDEVLDIFFCDNGQWFCLNPFGEVVNPYNEKLELLYGNGEGPNYI